MSNDDTPTMLLVPPERPHGEGRIVVSVDGLQRAHDAFSRYISDGSSTSIDLYAPDGEGYELVVERDDDLLHGREPHYRGWSTTRGHTVEVDGEEVARCRDEVAAKHACEPYLDGEHAVHVITAGGQKKRILADDEEAPIE